MGKQEEETFEGIQIPLTDKGTMLVGLPSRGSWVMRLADDDDIILAAHAIGLIDDNGRTEADCKASKDTPYGCKNMSELRAFLGTMLGIAEDGGVRPWRDFEGRLVVEKERAELNRLLCFVTQTTTVKQG